MNNERAKRPQEPLLIPQESQMLTELGIPYFAVEGRLIRIRPEDMEHIGHTLEESVASRMLPETKEKLQAFHEQTPIPVFDKQTIAETTPVDQLFLRHNYGDRGKKALAKKIRLHVETLKKIFNAYALRSLTKDEEIARNSNPQTIPAEEKRIKQRQIRYEQIRNYSPEELAERVWLLQQGSKKYREAMTPDEQAEERRKGREQRLKKDCKMTLPEQRTATMLKDIGSYVELRQTARPGQCYFGDSRNNKTYVSFPDTEEISIPDFVLLGMYGLPIGIIEVFGGTLGHQEEFAKKNGSPEAMWSTTVKEKTYQDVGIPTMVLVEREVILQKNRDETIKKIHTFIANTLRDSKESSPAFHYYTG